MLKRSGIIGNKWNGIWTGGLDVHEEGNWQWFMENSTFHHTIRWSPGTDVHSIIQLGDLQVQ